MTKSPEQPERGLARLSQADAELLDRLLAGEPIADAQTPRADRLRAVLGVLDRWPADDAEPGLAERAYTALLAAQPVSLSDADGLALDAWLELRHAGLADGPMPSGARERADHVKGLMELLDQADGGPVPAGLAERTLERIEEDRSDQRRRATGGRGASVLTKPGGLNIRQLASAAALIALLFSVLLPMLDKGRRDAMIAQCSSNLAGLGTDLQSYADDNKGFTQPNADPAPSPPAMFRELSSFARKDLDGSPIPASNASLFLLVEAQRVDSDHLTCPSADPKSNNAYYNGQNPIAGGPLRVFLDPRPIYADTNPLYQVTPTGLVRNPASPDLAQSRNHDGKGQNSLISDGSVNWTARPTFAGPNDQEDNIWLLNNDAEKSGGTLDVFLTP